MADGVIQVPADSTGKRVDTNEVGRPQPFSDGTTVVERQRVEIPGKVTVSGDAIRLILVELRVHSLLMAQAFGINHDLHRLRQDVMEDTDQG